MRCGVMDTCECEMVQKYKPLGGMTLTFMAIWLDESAFRIIRRPQIHGFTGVLFGKSKAEAVMSSRRSVLLCVTLGGLIFVWLGWWYHSSQQQARETPPATIDRRPVSFANRTFDPPSPPADMTTLGRGGTGGVRFQFLVQR